jgi:hypothetical protein
MAADAGGRECLIAPSAATVGAATLSTRAAPGSKPDVSTSTTTKSLARSFLQHCCLHRQDCGCCWRTVVLRTYSKALDVGGQDAARFVAVRPDLTAQSIVIKSLPASSRISFAQFRDFGLPAAGILVCTPPLQGR